MSTIVLSAVMAFYYPFDIFKLFFSNKQHLSPSSCHLVIFDGFLNIHVTVINEPKMHCIYFIHYFFKLWFLLFAFCLSAMLSIETSLFITLFVMWEWSNVGSIWAQLKPHLWRWCYRKWRGRKRAWGVFSGALMRKRKLRNICPSWAFPPVVTLVTWPRRRVPLGARMRHQKLWFSPFFSGVFGYAV